MLEYTATIEEENKEIAKRYKDLLKDSYQTLSRADKLMIRKAFNLSGSLLGKGAIFIDKDKK